VKEYPFDSRIFVAECFSNLDSAGEISFIPHREKLNAEPAVCVFTLS
jgi:hypothetical protein